MKITPKNTIKRFELISKFSQFLCVFVYVDLHAWFGLVPDCFSEIKGVGVKNDKMISANEHRYICQVVNCIKTKSKFSNFFGIMLFSRTAQFCYVLEILVLKLGIVVNPQCRALAVAHPIINQTGHGILVCSFIVQKVNFRRTSIVCVLNKLLWNGKSVCIIL